MMNKLLLYIYTYTYILICVNIYIYIYEYIYILFLLFTYINYQSKRFNMKQELYSLYLVLLLDVMILLYCHVNGSEVMGYHSLVILSR